VHDYYCGGCSSTSELWLGPDEVAVCPECGSTAMTVIFLKAPASRLEQRPYDKLDTYHDYLTKPIKAAVPSTYKSRKPKPVAG
jgi:DNA-directed RNA polymerase subunit RPC12/RpoP